jgi:Eco57I restriction-modification methylase
MTMRQTFLDSDAKESLRKTVRRLRTLLLDHLYEAGRGEYRLDTADIDKAKLPEARRCRRERLGTWLDEHQRVVPGKKGGKPADLRRRALDQAVKEAAHTWLNRLVFLRILEHHGLLSPAVVTGGWKSPGYSNEFVRWAGPLATDDTLGMLPLLQAVFAELALELPGLFGRVGLTELFPMPAAALRETIEALNDPALDSAWGDDTTLGWVYQYWNDPEREALDAKIAGGGKIEPHEIASKTQMFTERYMVEWLLHNSLGLTWLCVCKKHGWAPEAEPVLAALDARRAEWRKKREAGEVALDALIPIKSGLESAWKYYVPQPIPADAIEKAPASIRELKLLDPACGSGHFLVIAFDLLARLHQEEARHRGETWSDAEIAQSIIANNLHGIDIDARAIQIAAAGLWLKARLFAPAARLSQLSLVAPTLELGNLPKDDPALIELRQELKREVNLPEELTQKLVSSLSGVSYLGSLLRVDAAIEQALRETELVIEQGLPGQGNLFHGFPSQQLSLSIGQAKATVLDRLESFLSRHSSSEDLGLRLDGEQLAAGVRFVRLAQESRYDIVIGNPPYQGLSKTAQFEYVTKSYPRGKADLYAAFLERGLELVREGGLSALVTIRGWMFLTQFTDLRTNVLAHHRVVLGDLGWGAFELMTDNPVTMSIIQRNVAAASSSLALSPSDPTARIRTDEHRRSLAAGLLAQVGRYEFDPKGFDVIEGEPIVYWWSKKFLDRYAKAPKLGAVAEIRQGLSTADNARFLRKPWEVPPPMEVWAPLVKGSEGRMWIEPLSDVVRWSAGALELNCFEGSVLRNPDYYFRTAVAFPKIGATFSARAYLNPSVFADAGSSAFVENIAETVCLLNSVTSRFILTSLNPTVNFQVGDVTRLPIFPVANAADIFTTLVGGFSEDESHREPSVEFKSPGSSPWRYAQNWAQRAVDRPEGAPLPPYEPELEPAKPEDFVSFAIGVALGRFGAHSEGILEQAPPDALPAGILFVTEDEHLPDSLQHPAAQRIADAWAEHAPAISKGKAQPLRDYLRRDFFTYHKSLYENRPIYLPLSSEKRAFVAYVSIHRWQDNTLQVLLADHLKPLERKLDGEIVDLNRARASSDKKAASAADKQYANIKKLKDELSAFIGTVSALAERGAPPTDPKCPPRAADAPFRMDLDDGVMIHSAAL